MTPYSDIVQAVAASDKTEMKIHLHSLRMRHFLNDCASNFRETWRFWKRSSDESSSRQKRTACLTAKSDSSASASTEMNNPF